jgi:signal transduction histidine kinase
MRREALIRRHFLVTARSPPPLPLLNQTAAHWRFRAPARPPGGGGDSVRQANRMSLILEFLEYIDRQPGQSLNEVLAKTLRKSRLLTNAEAGTIYLKRQDQARSWLEPVSLQNDKVALSPANFTLPIDRTSIAGFVAANGHWVLIDDAYRIPQDRPYRFDDGFDRANGYRTRSIMAFPLKNYGGQVIGVVQIINRRSRNGTRVIPFTPVQAELGVAIGQVISRIIERTTLLEAIAEQNDTLAQRNAELMRQRGEISALADGLRDARDEAERASRAKSLFLACMGHELRTPLNHIVGFAEILRDERFGPLGNSKYKDYAADLAASGTHLNRMVNDVLEMARGVDGRIELNEDDIDTEETIRAAAAAVNNAVTAAGLALTLDVAAGLPHLWADPRCVRKCLDNLLSNALKFTPAGGWITIVAAADAFGGVNIDVVDTGIGIAEPDIEKALSPFGQIDGELNRRYEGLGLGLPLARELMKAHGGLLSLASGLGVGTRASLRFPPSRVVAAQGPAVQAGAA